MQEFGIDTQFNILPESDLGDESPLEYKWIVHAFLTLPLDAVYINHIEGPGIVHLAIMGAFELKDLGPIFAEHRHRFDNVLKTLRLEIFPLQKKAREN